MEEVASPVRNAMLSVEVLRFAVHVLCDVSNNLLFLLAFQDNGV